MTFPSVLGWHAGQGRLAAGRPAGDLKAAPPPQPSPARGEGERSGPLPPGGGGLGWGGRPSRCRCRRSSASWAWTGHLLLGPETLTPPQVSAVILRLLREMMARTLNDASLSARLGHHHHAGLLQPQPDRGHAPGRRTGRLRGGGAAARADRRRDLLFLDREPRRCHLSRLRPRRRHVRRVDHPPAARRLRGAERQRRSVPRRRRFRPPAGLASDRTRHVDRRRRPRQCDASRPSPLRISVRSATPAGAVQLRPAGPHRRGHQDRADRHRARRALRSRIWSRPTRQGR